MERLRSYSAIVKIDKAKADLIERYLKDGSLLGEDGCVSVTVPFPDGAKMDIKCCGTREPGKPGWTEAVLFVHGSETSCSEVYDEFLGEWTLEKNGVRYTASVIAEGEPT